MWIHVLVCVCVCVRLCVYGVGGNAMRCERREIVEAGGEKRGLKVEGVM